MANCACASGWGCLMNLDLSLLDSCNFVPEGKILGHRELEVHTYASTKAVGRGLVEGWSGGSRVMRYSEVAGL